MAEKEERIRVLLAKNPCKECSVKKCTRKCTFGLLFEKAPGMTRQEAIERMAKALYLFNREDEWYKEHADMYSKYMNKMAEAALNALLEGK